MKRLLIVMLLLFAGVVIALPGAVGLIAEKEHDAIVERINGYGNQLTEERYERGWFSTSTRYRYRIEDEQLRELAAMITAEPEGTPELLVSSEIYHGPLPLISGGIDHAFLAWTDMDSTLLLRSPSGVETALPGQLQSRIEPDGSSRFRYHADAESHTLQDGLALSWNDADIDLVLGRNRDKLSVDGDIGVIRLSDADAALEIGPAVVTATQQRTRNGLWTGDTAIVIDGLSLPGFAADDLSLQTRVRESSGQATYAVELKADDFRGDGFAGDNAHVDFFAHRLDAAALGSLLQLISEYQGAIPASQREALLTRLLAAGPEITLRTLRIPLPDANLEGEAFVTIAPGTGIGLRELSRGAKGNTTLLLPMSVIKQIKAGATTELRSALELMMRLRVLKPEGNRYRVEAAFDNGLLTVNGFPVPLPVF